MWLIEVNHEHNGWSDWGKWKSWQRVSQEVKSILKSYPHTPGIKITYQP